ncbi:MAG: hypothetical protein DHS20C18_51000 [Saprospiraceae bacterium]|nr:MAG: hypothetical protein DHS20C18_51000 [Saprospiraceae bacterium]
MTSKHALKTENRVARVKFLSIVRQLAFNTCVLLTIFVFSCFIHDAQGLGNTNMVIPFIQVTN